MKSRHSSYFGMLKFAFYFFFATLKKITLSYNFDTIINYLTTTKIGSWISLLINKGSELINRR